MADSVTLKINPREFNATLRRYSQLSKRTPAEIVNRKAYFIARRAIWYTRKASVEGIKHELDAADAFELRINKAGKNKGKFSRAKRQATVAFNNTASGAAGRFERIVVGRMRKAGKAIPKAAELAVYLVKAFKARLRSIGFVKSGFVPARDKFKAWCNSHNVSIGGRGLPPNDKSAKQVGPSAKGGAAPATLNWFARAVFYNAANAKRGNDRGLQFARAGLEQAFAEEQADTLKEIETRLRRNAQKCGIKTN